MATENIPSLQSMTSCARTKIILELREDAKEFAKADEIKRIVHEYSNFIPFPILINNETTNTVQAIWAKNQNEVTEEEYKDFYKFIANAYNEPMFRLHFSADAPISIRSLLFVPDSNFEKNGLWPCRSRCESLLPPGIDSSAL